MNITVDENHSSNEQMNVIVDEVTSATVVESDVGETSSWVAQTESVDEVESPKSDVGAQEMSSEVDQTSEGVVETNATNVHVVCNQDEDKSCNDQIDEVDSPTLVESDDVDAQEMSSRVNQTSEDVVETDATNVLGNQDRQNTGSASVIEKQTNTSSSFESDHAQMGSEASSVEDLHILGADKGHWKRKLIGISLLIIIPVTFLTLGVSIYMYIPWSLTLRVPWSTKVDTRDLSVECQRLL